MLYEFGQQTFDIRPGFNIDKSSDPIRWILFDQQQLLSPQLHWSAFKHCPVEASEVMYVAHVNGIAYACAHIKADELTSAYKLDPQSVLQDNESGFMLISRAKQLLLFNKQHKYCGACGKLMSRINWEHARHCYDCNIRSYPKITPCIIVLVVKDGQVLLAKNKRSKKHYYSLLAGFIEVGESVEHAVLREVREEVGIEVKHISYLNSQSWPFDHQLMLGFVAEYASGEIEIDRHELLDAKWFDLDQLPTVPPKYTISRWILEQYRSLQQR